MDEKLLAQVVEIAKTAGKTILPSFGLKKESLDVVFKSNNTPVTKADLAAHDAIFTGLSLLKLDLPILSEEGEIKAYGEREHWDRYWLTDPLDGTRGFVAGSGEFSVNIALIENGRPILGVIYAPVLGYCCYAAQNLGAFVQQKDQPAEKRKTTTFDWSHYRVVLGHFLSKKILLSIYADDPKCEVIRLNSSLKFCWIAQGKADIYPRFGQTGEWDTAAGQCILEEAGGCLVDLDGQSLQYNAKASLINPPFVAIGDPSQSKKIIEFLVEKRRN
jgi:3'(2'), 5'-bisphosphate nucleotidase